MAKEKRRESRQEALCCLPRLLGSFDRYSVSLVGTEGSAPQSFLEQLKERWDLDLDQIEVGWPIKMSLPSESG